MHILWLKTELLHPVDKGGRIRTYQMLRALARSHEITYLCLDDGAGGEDAVAKSGEYSTRLVRVPFQAPERGSPQFALAVAGSLATRLPYAIQRYRSSRLSCEIERLVSKGGVDVIVCDFLAPAVNVRHPTATPSVLFQHNVEAEIWRRHAEVPGNAVRRRFFEGQWRRMERFEAKSCRQFDHVVAVSAPDAEYFSHRYGAPSVSYVATGVDTQYFSPDPARQRDDATIVFLGSMDWLPNEDAVAHFVQEVLPLVRARVPGVRLQIVGRKPGPRVQQLAATHPGVEVTGTVADVRPYLSSATLMAVPLRIGGGTRLKIYEAMAMGCPVVSTAIGAEGLPLKDGEHFLAADTPAEQAEACISLLQDPVAGGGLGARALEYVRQHFSWTSIAEEFAAACQSTVDRRRAINANGSRS